MMPPEHACCACAYELSGEVGARDETIAALRSEIESHKAGLVSLAAIRDTAQRELDQLTAAAKDVAFAISDDHYYEARGRLRDLLRRTNG